ncbi:AtpZ/AtpI family protein [Candidatus Sumerlaeota bacterium]|nr:AtpZ/AtpI family protein [Candidatus Sumerlaeota bacterium]
MRNDPGNSRPEYTRQLRLAGVALAIPTILAVSPLVGFYLGRWIGGLFDKPQAVGIVGLVLGFAAGVRETIRLIRRIQSELK